MAIPKLAMIPSGYKANKVYSVLPTDGSGDLDFARTTKATRVNSGGLIEEVAIGVPRLDYTDGSCPSLLLEPSSTNLITQSESFANTYWNKSGASIQGDASTAGAEKVTNGNFASSSDWTIVNSDTNATSAIANGYLKLKTNGIFTQAAQNMGLVVGKTYKFTYEILSSDGGNLGLVNSNNNTKLIPSSVGFHTIYFQPNNGTFALKRYSGALDVQIDNVSVKEVSGFSAPSVDSPLGAFKLVEDTSVASNHRIDSQNFSVVASGSITISVILKYDGREWVKVRDFTTNAYVFFNILDNSIGHTNLVNSSQKIVDLGNGFKRVSFTYASTSTNAQVRIYLASSGSEDGYTGDGTSGVYIFGAQVEQQSSATSYIPTAGTTISRTADSASKSGISSLINSSEGVLYVQISAFANDLSWRGIQLMKTGNVDNQVNIGYNTETQSILSQVRVGGSLQYNQSFTVSDITTSHKIAIRYATNDFKVYIDGVAVGTHITSGVTFSANFLDSIEFNFLFGNSNFNGNVKQLQVFKTALTDAELTTLTTL